MRFRSAPSADQGPAEAAAGAASLAALATSLASPAAAQRASPQRG